MSDNVHQAGGCLCGAVRYRVAGRLRDAVACHCGQCRRVSGHYAAFTACRNERVSLETDGTLAWYESSPGVRRGFCSNCGSTLFWDHGSRPYIAVAAASLDAPTGIGLTAHLFVADKGDYYEIADGLPQYPQAMD
jgi:hypothetical protein